jgi:hypothetical protein
MLKGSDVISYFEIYIWRCLEIIFYDLDLDLEGQDFGLDLGPNSSSLGLGIKDIDNITVKRLNMIDFVYNLILI